MKHFLRKLTVSSFGGFLLLQSNLGLAVNEPDYLGYPVDSLVRIYINWDSFEAQGIPANWKGPFQDVVINTYTRWRQVAGFRLDPRFYGYTTNTSPGAGEILISMNSGHGGRLASRFGQPAHIVFHRKHADTDTDWNWTPYRAEAGEYDMMAVLMHEMGHAFGIEHNTDGNKSVMDSYKFHDRYGPFQDDITDIRAQYGTKTNSRFRAKRSTDSASSWHDSATNLTGLNLTTHMNPNASRDPSRTMLFYSHANKHPAWIIGNNTGATFDTSKWWVYGGLRSAYGTGGHGYDNEYMMTWVDDTNNHDVKVVYSNDSGESFVWRNASGAKSFGTPAVHKVAANTWVLAYSRYNTADRTQNAKIVTRVSTNDGASWGPEVVLNSFYAAASGITLSSNGTGEVRIGFAWEFRTTATNYLKRTIVAHVSGSDLVYDRMIYESESTRTVPVLTKNSSQFIQAWREPNFATSINTRRSAPGTTTFNDYVRVVEASPTTPALAAYRSWGFAYLYYLDY